MRITLISLLLSIITIGTTLHTSEDDYERKDDLGPTKFNLAAASSEIDQASTQVIETLDDARKLSEKIFVNSQKRDKDKKTNLTKIFNPEILGNDTFNPQVFVDYSDDMGVANESEPGCYQRLCCRKDRKNRFEHMQTEEPAYYKSLVQRILIALFPIKTTTPTVNLCEKRINQIRGSGNNTTISDKLSKEQLQKLNEQLQVKIQLNKQLRKFIDLNRKYEDNSIRSNNKMCFGFTTVVIVILFATLYSSS